MSVVFVVAVGVATVVIIASAATVTTVAVVAATGITEAAVSITKVVDVAVDAITTDAETTGAVIEVVTSAFARTVDFTTAVAWDSVVILLDLADLLSSTLSLLVSLLLSPDGVMSSEFENVKNASNRESLADHNYARDTPDTEPKEECLACHSDSNIV